MLKFSSALLLACLTVPAHAGWRLDNESSRLSFVSTKDSNIAEVSRFRGLIGDVSDAGQVHLQVELSSVDSGIALRDELLRKVLFQSSQFDFAHVHAQLDFAPILALAAGAQMELRLPLQLDLHGSQHHYISELLVTRLDDRRFQVVTLAPLVLKASDFGLATGLETLRAQVGLSTISLAVPVSAVLIFNLN
jgi:hypothetical protein